jgi:hypothetical protein
VRAHEPNQIDTGLEKGGGVILNAHQKNDYGAAPYILEIADVGEAYLIFE